MSNDTRYKNRFNSEIKEYQEAYYAGVEVLGNIEQAINYVKSARNWGILDIFGGGFVSDFFKHSKLKKAKNVMNDTQYLIKTFNTELADINLSHITVEIGGFLSFADFFFDGLIADLTVQSKISKLLDQLNSEKTKVELILSKLEKSIY